jgi:hypothetical protein
METIRPVGKADHLFFLQNPRYPKELRKETIHLSKSQINLNPGLNGSQKNRIQKGRKNKVLLL